jgi:hypothetical protein
MPTPRRSLLALTASAAGVSLAVSMALAPSAGSAGPQERASGTSGAKTYTHLAAKKDYVRLDLLALNDFHGNLQPPTGSSGQINSTKAGGAAYLARRRQERQTREAARNVAAQLVDDVDSALRAHALDAVRLPPQNRELSGHSGDMLLNGAYLLDADQVDALRATADELQERYADHGAHIVVTGPWPPYNFAAGEAPRQPA